MTSIIQVTFNKDLIRNRVLLKFISIIEENRQLIIKEKKGHGSCAREAESMTSEKKKGCGRKRECIEGSKRSLDRKLLLSRG